MLKILILGYGPMGKALSRGVLACPQNASIVGVFPWSHHRDERHQPQEESERQFLQWINDHQLPLIQEESANSYTFVQRLNALRPDIVLVGSWGEILKPHVLQVPGVQFINCHSSLLPFHRGPNPYMAVIMAGESRSGITFHLMDKGIDTGPILMQAEIPLAPDETGLTLRQRCAKLAEETLPRLLEALDSNSLEPRPQSTDEGSYDMSSPDMAWINWGNPPQAIERQIRGLYPWMHSLARLGRYTIGFRFGQLGEAPGVSNELLAQPGRIIAKVPSGIWVSTIAPSQQLFLQQPYILGYPEIVSKLLCKRLITPGKRFK